MVLLSNFRVKDRVILFADAFPLPCRRLMRLTKESVIRQASDQLWKLARAPPLQIRNEEGEGEEEMLSAPRIMVACHGQGTKEDSTPTVLIQLDGNGQLVDRLQCAQLSGNLQRSQGSIMQDPRKEKVRAAGRANFFVIEVLCCSSSCTILKHAIIQINPVGSCASRLLPAMPGIGSPLCIVQLLRSCYLNPTLNQSTLFCLLKGAGRVQALIKSQPQTSTESNPLCPPSVSRRTPAACRP